MALADLRQSGAGRPAGVLWPAQGQDLYQIGRDEQVPEPVSLVVGHLWSVRWRRPAAFPFTSQVLSHPIAHLTFEDAVGGRLHGHPVPAALVHGLVTRVFSVALPTAGRVTGIAFHPGGLAALLGTSARELTDRVVPATQLLGRPVEAVAREILHEPDEQVRGRTALAYLGEVLHPVLDPVAGDPAYRMVREATALMRDREHRTLAPVAEHVNVSPRTLQRHFARYVGASPLWVLRRYRVQDAVTALDRDEGTDLAGLAASLGFADQAHLTRSFTAVIGVPPSRYRAGDRPSARADERPSAPPPDARG